MGLCCWRHADGKGQYSINTCMPLLTGAGAAQGQQGQQAAAPAAAAGPNTQPLDMFNPQVMQAPLSTMGMPA